MPRKFRYTYSAQYIQHMRVFCRESGADGHMPAQERSDFVAMLRMGQEL